MPSKKKPTGDYPVGYARPPVNTRWSPGVSGNPRGPAPPEALDMLRYVGGASKRRVPIPIGRKVVKMTVMEACAHKMATDAAMGVASARRDYLKLLNFAAAIDTHRGPTVIKAKLVFDEEENRVMVLARQVRELSEQNEQMRELLSPEARALIGPVPVDQRPWTDPHDVDSS